MAKTKEEKSADAKRKRLMLYYRITPEEQEKVEEFQRNDPTLSKLLERGNLDDTSPALLFTDHDHTTGLFRGRLAYLINKALGTFESSYKERTPAILKALAEYLEYPPAVRVIGPRFGLIGRAKKKKRMIYGSINGPIQPEKVRKCPKLK